MKHTKAQVKAFKAGKKYAIYWQERIVDNFTMEEVRYMGRAETCLRKCYRMVMRGLHWDEDAFVDVNLDYLDWACGGSAIDDEDNLKPEAIELYKKLYKELIEEAHLKADVDIVCFPPPHVYGDAFTDEELDSLRYE